MSQQSKPIKKESKPRKVYSFKAELSPDSIVTVESWLVALEEVWNHANKLMDTKRLILSIRHNQDSPSDTATWQDSVSDTISKMRAKKWWPEDSFQQVIPTTIRDGLLDTLKKSWKRYYDDRKKGAATGKPKFKGEKRPVKTLITLNGQATVKVSPCKENSKNAWVKFPGMEPFRIKGYYKRFEGGLEYGKVALTKDGGEYFIQFTATFTPADVLRNPTKKVGVDPGIKAVVATSEGQVIKPRRKLENLKKRIKRLSRKLARQQKGSTGSAKTKSSMNRVHAKVRRQRKGFNAKLADWLGRFDIAFEGSRLRDMSRRAKPKLREDGNGYERNNAKAKSGLNRELLDNGLGQVRQLTEARCKSRGRDFVKTSDGDVRYSSQRCHCCGDRGKRISQSVFTCLNSDCQLFQVRQHADVNGAKNHVKAGYNIPIGIYPSAMGKVMPVESGATLAGQPGSQSTVAALLEASETTPEASKEKSLQALGSAKDHTKPIQLKALKHKASGDLPTTGGACVPSRKGFTGLQPIKPKAPPRKGRAPCKSGSGPLQLGLFD